MTGMAEVDDVVRRLVESWNRRDEEAFAGLFTPSAEYVTGKGERVRGRHAIARLLRQADPRLSVSVAGAPSAEWGAGRGTARFRWMAVQPGGPTRRGNITCVVARHQGRWLIETLENSEAAAAGGVRERPR